MRVKCLAQELACVASVPVCFRKGKPRNPSRSASERVLAPAKNGESTKNEARGRGKGEREFSPFPLPVASFFVLSPFLRGQNSFARLCLYTGR